MANEIQLAYGVSGRVLYAVLRTATGTVWNGAAFEAYAGANWATYAITMTEQGTSGYYAGAFPAAAAGVYFLEVRDRAGGSPALTDPLAGAGSVEWDGAAVTPLASRLPTASYTAPPSAAAVAAQVLASGDVDGFTLEQTLKLCLAALAGKISGAATTTITIRAADDSKSRIVATVTGDGDRTTVTLDPTG